MYSKREIYLRKPNDFSRWYVIPKHIKRERGGWYDTYRNKFIVSYREAIEKGALLLRTEKGKVVGPNVADVVSCLLIDYNACGITFDNWCSDYNYNNDSIKNLNTYIQSQRNSSKLLKLLGYDLVNKLAMLEH